jgi:hypothetical protein
MWNSLVIILKKSLLKVQGTFHPISGHSSPEEEWKYSFTLPLTLATDGDGWLKSCLGPFNPRKDPLPTVHEVVWADMDGYGKFRPQPRFNPQTVHPVLSCCTNWATLALTTDYIQKARTSKVSIKVQVSQESRQKQQSLYKGSSLSGVMLRSWVSIS